MHFLRLSCRILAWNWWYQISPWLSISFDWNLNWWCNFYALLGLQVFEDMLAKDIMPITQHFVTFLVACAEAPLTTQHVKKSFGRAMSFCKSNGGDCSIYSSLLKFIVSQGVPEKAVDVWRQIQQVHFFLLLYTMSLFFSIKGIWLFTI